MADISFLKLAPTKQQAWDLGDSPIVNYHYLDQIQFLPQDPNPYFQVTSSEESLTIDEENYEVYLVRCSDGRQWDVTDRISLQPFTENGVNQLKIVIKYLCQDFHENLMYLQIYRGFPEEPILNYYSNRFLVTRVNQELTTRVDYYDRSRIIDGNPNYRQAIRLRFYFNNDIDRTEIATYHEISTNQTVNPRVTLKEYAEWATLPFNSYCLKRLKRALLLGRCYFNLVRQNAIEFDINSRESQSNISENTFITDPKESDKLNPSVVVIACPNEPDPGGFYRASSGLPSSNDLPTSSEFEQ